MSTPRVGIHAPRIPLLDVAAVDTVLTVLLALIVARLMHWPFWATALGLFLVSVPAHWLAGVETRVIEAMRSSC